MATHKPWLGPFMMEKAKILVEVVLSKAFQPRIAVGDKYLSQTLNMYSYLQNSVGMENYETNLREVLLKTLETQALNSQKRLFQILTI